MKKLSAIVLALALTVGAASGFAAGKAKGVPEACRDLKGKERAACIKSEKAKNKEAKKAAPSEGSSAKAPAAGSTEGSK